MNTLIDFVRFTKGWEYVIAILAVFSFIGFWMLWQTVAADRPAESKKPAYARQQDASPKAFQPGHSGSGMQAGRQQR